MVHRQGHDPYWKYDKRGLKLREEWRAATTHPESIRTVHSITTRYLRARCFQSVCSGTAICRSHQ
jgi:hypothetical protein